MYEGDGTGESKALSGIINTLGFSVLGFFDESFESTQALCPKTEEPFAAGRYGKVPHQGIL